MTFVIHQGGAEDAAEAAAWVVRLSGETVDVDDFEAFDAWLAEGENRPAAYDRALEAWTAADELGSLPKEVRPPSMQRRSSAWLPLSVAGGAVAAGVAAAVFLGMGAPAERYVTGPGQHREVALADGSHVAINAGSRLEVRWSRNRRDVKLAQGEAAFDVAKDPARPFIIHAGARSVRVVGTEFDVRARDELFVVAVRRGIVEVRNSDGAAPVRLTKGDSFAMAGDGDQGRLTHVDPDDAFAWRTGRLIFRNASIAEVVSDLNLQFGAPAISVSEAAGRLRFSGVLSLDGRAAVVRRLTAALPLSSSQTPSGIVLDMASLPTP